MTHLSEFISLVDIAERAYKDKDEASIEAFLQVYKDYPAPSTILEAAMLEVLEDLTMHEYLCQGEHKHTEEQNG